jgi:FkbM family methyltransferase
MTFIRDLFRKRRVRAHLRAHGPVFNFHGLSVRVPEGVDIALANALIKSKYEREEAAFVRAYLPSSVPVIELGGSIGVVAALIGDRLEHGIPHLIVEANPNLCGICLENASQRGARTATEVLNAALSYEGPEVSFTVSGNEHISRLSSIRKPIKGGRTITVASVTLAELHAGLGAPEGYSLVCDIEGGETAMVEHDAETLAKAGLILLETHPAYYAGGEGEAAELCARILALGFYETARDGNVLVFTRTP